MSHDSARPSHRTLGSLGQFSLRTMLILMTVCAIGIWWYRDSTATLTPLADGAVLRVTEKPLGVGASPTADSPHASGQPGTSPQVRHGQATVHDTFGRLLLKGSYRMGQPTGTWRAFHENGRVQASVRVGDVTHWQTWHSTGYRQQVTETTTAPPQTADYFTDRIAVREWYDNGQMRLQGQRLNGVRVGEWTYWDRDSQVLAQGEYTAGLRSGPWEITTAAGSRCEVFYVRGVASQGAPEVFSGIESALTSSDVEQRRDAIHTLLSLGSSGQSRLAELLRQGPAVDQMLVLQGIVAHRPRDAALTTVLASLPAFEDTALNRQLLFARYVADPSSRVEALTQLLTPLPHLSRQQQSDLLQQLGALEEDLPATLEQILQASERADVHRPAVQLLSVRLRWELSRSWPSNALVQWVRLLRRLEIHPDAEVTAAASALLALVPRALLNDIAGVNEPAKP